LMEIHFTPWRPQAPTPMIAGKWLCASKPKSGTVARASG
jgi:hypothetical protein